MSLSRSYTKTGPGRLPINGKPQSRYNPTTISGAFTTYAGHDAIVRERLIANQLTQEMEYINTPSIEPTDNVEP